MEPGLGLGLFVNENCRLRVGTEGIYGMLAEPVPGQALALSPAFQHRDLAEEERATVVVTGSGGKVSLCFCSPGKNSGGAGGGGAATVMGPEMIEVVVDAPGGELTAAQLEEALRTHRPSDDCLGVGMIFKTGDGGVLFNFVAPPSPFDLRRDLGRQLG